jgi:ribonuclease D
MGHDAQYTLVEDKRDLGRIALELEGEKAIGVDIEADSMFHYQERVCLLQIATPTRNLVVDPLAVGDLSPLAPLFASSRTQKVFHGGDFDIRSLHRDFTIEVRSVFDTQIAARFLGLKETGLASLLRERFGVCVEKKYQKRNWSERPLPSPMLDYAVKDVSYLLPLAGILKRELRLKNRLSWVREECDLLCQVRSTPRDSSPLFLKFRGAGRLPPRALAVLEALLTFRDQTARMKDRPPFKVLANDAIVEMAREMPKTESELKRIKGLSPKLISTLGRSLLERIEEARKIPDSALPVYPHKGRPRLGRRVTRRIEALKAWRKKRGEDLDLEPSIVLTGAQIQSLALSHPLGPKDLRRAAGLRSWQRRAFGEEICEALAHGG